MYKNASPQLSTFILTKASKKGSFQGTHHFCFQIAKGGSYSPEPMLSNISWKHLFRSSTANLLATVSKRGNRQRRGSVQIATGCCRYALPKGHPRHLSSVSMTKKRITVTEFYTNANSTWLLWLTSLKMGWVPFLWGTDHAFCLPSLIEFSW